MRMFKRILKIILGVIGVALVAGIVYVLFHLNAVLLMFGKGNLKLNDLSKTQQALKSSSVYTTTETTQPDGTKVLQCVSKDQAVQMTITSKNGDETVTGTVDTGKLPSVEKTNLGELQKLAKNYLGPILSDDQIAGLGGYAVKQKLSGGDINVNQSYGGATVNVTSGGSGTLNFSIKTTK